MKLTKGQNKMVNRALEGFTYNNEGREGKAKLFSLNAKYPGKVGAACQIVGSGEHRAARNLEAKGIGRVATCQPYDTYFFILNLEQTENIKLVRHFS